MGVISLLVLLLRGWPPDGEKGDGPRQAAEKSHQNTHSDPPEMSERAGAQP
jgi:hypothetical protein